MGKVNYNMLNYWEIVQPFKKYLGNKTMNKVFMMAFPLPPSLQEVSLGPNFSNKLNATCFKCLKTLTTPILSEAFIECDVNCKTFFFN